MKRKLIQRNKKKIDKLRKAAGWFPFELYMSDCYSAQALEEDAFYRMWDKEIRTKENRMNGSFEAWFGFAPSRYCVGRKGKIQK